MTSESLLIDLRPHPLKLMSVVIDGERTSVKIEPTIWNALVDISRREQLAVTELFDIIAIRCGDLRKSCRDSITILDDRLPVSEARDEPKEAGLRTVTLTTAIRVFIMNYFRHLAQGKALSHDGQNHLTTGTGAIGRDRSKFKDSVE